MRNFMNHWMRSTCGSIAMYMALMIPVLTGAIGGAIDMAETYLVQERLSRALDAAALAVAGSNNLESEDAMKARVDAFMDANYPAEKIGTAYNIQLHLDGDSVTVSATADYNTSFLRFLGFNTLSVNATSTVQKQVQGIEVALVLDNTGSMSYKPAGSTKTNIQALKDASTDFITIMFSKAINATDIRIGLVPYANTVRVGLYGVGQEPDPLTGFSKGTYNNGVTFVTLPAGKTVANFYAGRSGTSSNGTFNNSSSDHDNSSKWYGCIIEHKTGGWNINSSSNDPYPNDIRDDYTGPWEIYQYSTLKKTQGTCATWHCTSGAKTQTGCANPNKFVCDTYNYTYSITASSTPNSSCPYANIMPLNSDRDKLLYGVKSMQAHGNTQGNTGMIWGYRLISPEAPFTEGSAWNSENWKKAVIMMTDGDNTWDSDYSEYWLSQRSTSMSEATLDSRFINVCDALRAKNVLVYTIIFKSQTDPTQATKDMYKNCATKDTMYFYAPTQTDLQNVFEQIAHELSNLHISQ
jgi:Flp pilus assembly protein TadG